VRIFWIFLAGKINHHIVTIFGNGGGAEKPEKIEKKTKEIFSTQTQDG